MFSWILPILSPAFSMNLRKNKMSSVPTDILFQKLTARKIIKTDNQENPKKLYKQKKTQVTRSSAIRSSETTFMSQGHPSKPPRTPIMNTILFPMSWKTSISRSKKSDISLNKIGRNTPSPNRKVVGRKLRSCLIQKLLTEKRRSCLFRI